MDLQSWLTGASGHLTTGLLIFARFGALLFSAPLLGGKNVPNPVRLGLSALLAATLTPLLPPARIDSAVVLILALGKEVLFGLALGWTASMFFASVQMAGEWLDLQSGFQASQILNPAFDTHNALVGSFSTMLAGVVFLGTGAHATMLRAAVTSFTVSPPGSLRLGGAPLAEGRHALHGPGHIHGGAALAGADCMTLLTQVVWISVQLAAPVAAALFLAEIAIGLINRALPQVNVLMLTLPVKAVATVSLIALLVPVLASVMGAGFAQLGPAFMHVLRSMAG